MQAREDALPAREAALQELLSQVQGLVGKGAGHRALPQPVPPGQGPLGGRPEQAAPPGQGPGGGGQAGVGREGWLARPGPAEGGQRSRSRRRPGRRRGSGSGGAARGNID